MAVKLIPEQQARQQFDADTLVVRPSYKRTYWLLPILAAIILVVPWVTSILYPLIGSFWHLENTHPERMYWLMGLLGALSLILPFTFVLSFIFARNNRGPDNWILALSRKCIFINLRPMKHGFFPVMRDSLSISVSLDAIADHTTITRMTKLSFNGRLFREKFQLKCDYLVMALKEQLSASDMAILQKELIFQKLECAKVPKCIDFPYVMQSDDGLLIKWRPELRPALSSVVRHMRMVTFAPNVLESRYVS